MDFLTVHRETLTNLGYALLILVGAWIITRLMRRAVDRFLAHRALSELDSGARTRFRMIERLAATAFLFLGLGLALYVVDVSILRKISVAMFASAGLAGIALGFAAQTTAANLVSGVIISFVQPLRLGDRVKVEDEYGEVEEIGLFYTFIKTWDNRRVVIPNQLLSSRVIKNYTTRDARMAAAVSFKLDFGTDVEAVRSTLMGIVRAHPLAIFDPEPAVEVTDNDDSGITVRLLAWAVDQSSAWTLGTDVREQAVAVLATQGTAPSARRIALVDTGGGVGERPDVI